MAQPRTLAFVISEDYARLTGGWIYDQRLLAELAGLGWSVRHVTLPAGFPDPSEAARTRSAAAIGALPDGTLVLADQLCLGVLPEIAQAEGNRLRLVMIVHHPLALETGATPARRIRFANCEREALRYVSTVIATSPTTARTLAADSAVPDDRIVVAVPGIDRGPVARGSGGPVPHLLSVGAVVPRKNHGLLVAALAGLAGLPWRLTLVGNLTRAPGHAAALRARVAAAGLQGRITFAGELPADRLAALWARTDLYVASSRHEGYGMAIAEAFAHGVPVVTTAAGAAGAWIGRRGAIVVPGGSVPRLQAALRMVLASPGRRNHLRQDALARRQALPTWEAAGTTVHRRLAAILGRGS